MTKGVFSIWTLQLHCALKTCSKNRLVQILLVSYCCFSGHYSFKHLTRVISGVKQHLFLFCFILGNKSNAVCGLFMLFCRFFLVFFCKIYSEETGKYPASPRHAIHKQEFRF